MDGEQVMPGDEIYREKIAFTVGKLVVVLMICLAALFLALFLYQLSVHPIGENPAPNWYYLVMFLVFSGVSVLIVNFRELTVSATAQAITVAYGRIKYTITWDNVKDCYLDEKAGIAYGGWGIRIGTARGKSVLVYNVIGSPRVVLELNKGRYSQFAFSTRHPEAVMGMVQEQIGK
jgi:hypothetical protein